jgi:hypothetical protein
MVVPARVTTVVSAKVPRRQPAIPKPPLARAIMVLKPATVTPTTAKGIARMPFRGLIRVTPRALSVPVQVVAGAKPELLIDLGGNLYFDFVSGKLALKVA